MTFSFDDLAPASELPTSYSYGYSYGVAQASELPVSRPRFRPRIIELIEISSIYWTYWKKFNFEINLLNYWTFFNIEFNLLNYWTFFNFTFNLLNLLNLCFGSSIIDNYWNIELFSILSSIYWTYCSKVQFWVQFIELLNFFQFLVHSIELLNFFFNFQINLLNYWSFFNS